MNSPLDKKTVNRIYQKLSESMPDPKSELIFKNNFELLVAVMLSAQSTDKTVNSVTVDLFRQFLGPNEILECGETRLRTIIKPIGLAPTKAKNILKTCEILLQSHRAQVPDSREDLEKLPGVGRKTASVVLNEGFGEPTIAVDTHVFRVSNRTGLAPSKTVLEAERGLLKITPVKWKKQAHHYLILHGRYVCTAKNFKCGPCPIRKECIFEEKSL